MEKKYTNQDLEKEIKILREEVTDLRYKVEVLEKSRNFTKKDLDALYLIEKMEKEGMWKTKEDMRKVGLKV